MTARIATLVSALVAIMFASAPQAPQAARPQPGRHGGPPSFARADHFYKSPALRDIPRRAPQAGVLREAPRFRQAVGPKSFDPIVQSSPAPPLVPSPLLSFEGVGNLNAVLPPDTNGAIGPN